jgi:phage terminase small subunit
MGRRGKKPTSADELAKRGSRWAKQRREEEQAAHERAVSVEADDEPPAWLSEEARLLYDDAAKLKSTGVPFVDRHLLGRLATIKVQWHKDAMFVQEYGSCLRTKNSRGALSLRVFPQYRAMILGSAEISRLEKELGLSPSGRAAMGIVLKAPPTPEQVKAQQRSEYLRKTYFHD